LKSVISNPRPNPRSVPKSQSIGSSLTMISSDAIDRDPDACALAWFE
jgi:hypothetical protein